MKKTIFGVSLVLAGIAAVVALTTTKKRDKRLVGSTGKLALDWGGLPGGVLADFNWTIRPSEMR